MKTPITFGTLDYFRAIVLIGRTLTAKTGESVGMTDTEVYNEIKSLGLETKIVDDLSKLSYKDDFDKLNSECNKWLRYNHLIQQNRNLYEQLIAWLTVVSED